MPLKPLPLAKQKLATKSKAVAQNFRRGSNRKYLEDLLQGEGAGVGVVGVRRAEVGANLMGEKTYGTVRTAGTSFKTNRSQIKALHSLEAGMIEMPNCRILPQNS